MLSMTAERWMDVVGFEGLYRVSDHGSVLSCGRTVYDKRTGSRTKKPRLLKLTVDSAGYAKVTLYRGREKSVWKVHRLVATHFCEKAGGNDVVNHLDCDKLNNCWMNLEWTTIKGNNLHAQASGRQRPCIGEKSGTAKLTEEKVLAVLRMCEEKIPQTKIAKHFGISQQQVSKIKNGDRWAHTRRHTL